ncbi:MAG: LemA family protein [Chlamydiae bacterium]|nr:LemA family protein [Chlamydiota bacterium]MBI3265956.1 LemA family protein [Chlamydiota bacterium]
MKSWIWPFLGALLIGFIWLYNRMVSLKKRAQGAWSDIEVQLKRRHDLVPNLVSCVQGYMVHERGTLEKVTELRGKAQGLQQVSERGPVEGLLGSQVRTIVMLAEKYPDLKANATFLELQRQLTETEDRIQNARRYYNAVIRDFNILITQFPNLWVAKICHFGALEFFQLENQSEVASQKVSLS